MFTHEAAAEVSTSAQITGSAQMTGAPPQVRQGARVLIADDLAENRLLLGLYCDKLGFFHEGAENGYQAVEAARSGRFDLILMDILMPRMDGIAATETIRALPGPISSIPIIAVTTAAAPGEVLRYLACGMTDVVSKPINPRRLAEAMAAALPRAESEKQVSRSRPRNVARLRA